MNNGGGCGGGGGVTIEAVASGEQEVPSVTTDTSASVELEFDAGYTKVDYTLHIEDGVGVTQAHLHCAPAGTNGPVVAFLYGKIDDGVDFEDDEVVGTIENGDISPQEDCGGVPLNNVASLYHAIRQGYIYVNVHTIANPGGEVRGQLFV